MQKWASGTKPLPLQFLLLDRLTSYHLKWQKCGKIWERLLWYGVGCFKKISDKVTLWWCHDTTENIIYLNQPINQSLSYPHTHYCLTYTFNLSPPNQSLSHPPTLLFNSFFHSLSCTRQPPTPFFVFTQMYNSLNTDLLMWFPFAVSVCTQKFKSLIWRLSWWRIGWVMKRIVHIQDTVIWWNSTSDVSSSIKGNITERESLLKIIKFLVKMREMWV